MFDAVQVFGAFNDRDGLIAGRSDLSRPLFGEVWWADDQRALQALAAVKVSDLARHDGQITLARAHFGDQKHRAVGLESDLQPCQGAALSTNWRTFEVIERLELGGVDQWWVQDTRALEELFSEQLEEGFEREGFGFAWDVWWLEVDRRVDLILMLVQCGHGCPPRPSLEPSGSFDFWFYAAFSHNFGDS